MSVDALWMVPDKASAICEIKRILHNGARFVFTTWDCDAAPAAWIPQIDDHRPLLEEAGFTVEIYEETPRWEQIQRAIYNDMRDAKDTLVAEMGKSAAEPLLAEANLSTGFSDGKDYLSHMRRIFVVACTT
jgi:SAM-dependent methyltransferase